MSVRETVSRLCPGGYKYEAAAGLSITWLQRFDDSTPPLLLSSLRPKTERQLLTASGTDSRLRSWVCCSVEAALLRLLRALSRVSFSESIQLFWLFRQRGSL